MNLYENGKVINSTLFKKALEVGLRVGYIDIETTPTISMNYGNRKIFIGHKQVLRDTQITSVVIMDEKFQKQKKFEWKWIGDIVIGKDKVTGGGDDTELLRKTVREFDKYDVIVMQNGDKFDAPTLQYLLMKRGLRPIRNLISIDILKLSKRSFRRGSHSLDAQARDLNFGGKDKQDMDDAMAVARGDQAKAKERLAYNVTDTVLLRKVFWRQIDYYNFHQSLLNMLRLMTEEKKPYCVKCAARHHQKYLIETATVTLKNKTRQKRWQCKRCGHHWKIGKETSLF
jgi:DNA polymerase elongation subunit (family B)